MGSFNYENTETKMIGGKKIVRKVSIKKGRGYKSITKYHKGKKIYSVKKPIHSHHIELIKGRKFIAGLFNDCKHSNKTSCKHCNKTKKRRGGGKDNDIEMGPSPRQKYMGPIPPDPMRFDALQEKLRKHYANKPSTPEEVARFFDQGKPEERHKREIMDMAGEDTLGDPFLNEDLEIFSRKG